MSENYIRVNNVEYVAQPRETPTTTCADSPCELKDKLDGCIKVDTAFGCNHWRHDAKPIIWRKKT